jgi:hypothetical protein
VVTSSLNNQHKREKEREEDRRKEKAMDSYPYKLYCIMVYNPKDRSGRSKHGNRRILYCKKI